MIGLIALYALFQSQVVQTVEQAHVSRADTIVISGMSVRLWGLSTFPSQMSCSDDPAVPQSCDELGRQILEDRLSSAHEGLDLVSRQGHPRYAAAPHLRCTILNDTPDGEAIGKCEVLIPSCYGVACEDVWYDLAGQLIENGAATQRHSESLGAYDEEEGIARRARLGGWATSG